MNKSSRNDFTLVLGSEIPKKFINVFLEEFFSATNIKAERKECLAKIRVIAKDEASDLWRALDYLVVFSQVHAQISEWFKY